MKTLILYKSSTGFTQRYAEQLAEKTGIPALALRQATAERLAGVERIVFGGRVHAGLIDGWKKARELAQQCGARKLVLFATGGTPNAAEGLIAKLWEQNLTPEEQAAIPHFYLQAGMNYEKMGFLDRTLMKLVGRMMSKKQNKSADEAGFANAITSSYDISSPEYLEPLVAYLQGA